MMVTGIAASAVVSHKTPVTRMGRWFVGCIMVLAAAGSAVAAEEPLSFGVFPGMSSQQLVRNLLPLSDRVAKDALINIEKEMKGRFRV